MEETTGLRTFTHMWQCIFDYKGTASRKEYWIPFAIHAGIGMVAGLFAIIAIVGSQLGFPKALSVICSGLAILLTLYMIVSIVPWISLTVRRLHDTGKSGWWTFLLLVVGIGTIIILFFCSMAAGVSSFRPGSNAPETIYGPPEMFDPRQNIEEDVYGPPDFDPYENEEPAVYGPPEMLDDYDPENNMEEDVYGPPDMFNDGENQWDNEEIDLYEPEVNIEPTVYGPPEMFTEE